MSGVVPFYINIHNVTFGKATGGQTYQASVRVDSHYNRK